MSGDKICLRYSSHGRSSSTVCPGQGALGQAGAWHWLSQSVTGDTIILYSPKCLPPGGGVLHHEVGEGARPRKKIKTQRERQIGGRWERWAGKARGVNKAQPCTWHTWGPACCWLEWTGLFPGLNTHHWGYDFENAGPRVGRYHNIQGQRERLFSKLGQRERL